MAHLTNGAVDSLLGFLSTTVKGEVKLLSGVEGDIQFIKDEMDSMNGFLMYLTKMNTPHDDQVRAWMKQVRDITYVADDCIKLYMRDLLPPEGGGFWVEVGHIPKRLSTLWTRHCLGKKIHKLKDRVREVGKRRQRYSVTLPQPQAGGDNLDDLFPTENSTDEDRAKFLTALGQDHGEAPPPTCQAFDGAIGKLPASIRDEARTAIAILLPGVGGDHHVASVKMLLRALYACPYGTTQQELRDLSEKLEKRILVQDVPRQVMLFCYSKLSTRCKGCLQYLITFREEESISRTCLVRRWVAEGLLAGDQKLGTAHSMEEAGELCFNDLFFRGFLCPAAPAVAPTGLKLKSCKFFDDSVNKFVEDITKTDNFVSDLPTHLRHQIKIRETAREQPPQRPQLRLQLQRLWRSWPCDICGPTADDDDGKKLPPIDELVKYLRLLPKDYRLNVIDLGGCKDWIKSHHVKDICKWVPSLKYLSLRNTDISWLPKELSDLLHLETLDIRHTRVRATVMRRMFLYRLKHLLAGGEGENSNDNAPSTVLIPRKIGKHAEILRHVQTKDCKADLARVGYLKRLRKLGVVLDGSQDNLEYLRDAIAKRSESLRSLSVWITEPQTEHMAAGDGGFVTLPEMDNSGKFPKHLESLNIKCLKGRNVHSTGGNLPQWIEGLQVLSKITLRHSLLTGGGLRILGKLKSLRCLKLLQESYIECKVTLEEGEFEDLRILLLHRVSDKTAKLEFQVGAAPKLEKIVWNFDGTREITPDIIPGFDNIAKRLRALNINGVDFPEAFPLPGCRFITDLQ